MTTELLLNHLAGRDQAGTGIATPLIDPVLGHELARVDASGIDLGAAFSYAREEGGAGLKALSYANRAGLLACIATLLQAHRARYYEISTANSGTVKKDSAIDIEGAIYTLRMYAKLGESLGARSHLDDGEAVTLDRDGAFRSQHVKVPTRGLALFINAFNFPAWGLWEKAAPALLSGVPVIVKPASATAWLTQQMVMDVVRAGILPPGALSVVCGSPAGLLEELRPFDVVSFTGSAHTAAIIRSHAAVVRDSVRVNIEADSLNSALLVQDAASVDMVEILAREVAREMTEKSGQKCTAIRRIFVPRSLYGNVAEAIGARLRATVVGNPRNAQVQMGSLVSRSQLDAVRAGMATLARHAETLHDGATHDIIDADPRVACFIGPTLLGARDLDASTTVHDLEVFGPVATLIPYRDHSHALAMIRRGNGSLVASIYGDDPKLLGNVALALADTHGRVHVVSPDVASAHTGHGNVMPQSIHGGPGRAGGGEELGGLRALNFYHRRAAVQAGTQVLQNVA